MESVANVRFGASLGQSDKISERLNRSKAAGRAGPCPPAQSRRLRTFPKLRSDPILSAVRVIENTAFKHSTALRARAERSLRAFGTDVLRAFIKMWNLAFPVPPLPRGPDDPAPIAKAAALREPALLAEHVGNEEAKKVG